MPIRPEIRPPSSRVARHVRWALPLAYFFALALAAGASLVLWRSGLWLVQADAFERVRWAVVLAGESREMERTDAAAKLLLEGRVDFVILSGTRIFRNRHTSEFQGRSLREAGVEPGRILELRHDAYSTIEEATQLIRQFRLLGLDTVLVITSNFHSRRARIIFDKLAGGDPQVLVHPAEYLFYEPDSWWSSRESREIWLLEWQKMLFTAYELAWAGPLKGKAQFDQLIPFDGPVQPAGPGSVSAGAVADGGRRKQGEAAGAANAAGEGRAALRRADSLISAQPESAGQQRP